MVIEERKSATDVIAEGTTEVPSKLRAFVAQSERRTGIETYIPTTRRIDATQRIENIELVAQ